MAPQNQRSLIKFMFQWTFTRKNLQALLAKIDRNPQALAA
jgi:hypothetical protein